MEEVLARALQLFVALTGAYALALWFALIVWTYRDITSRTANAVTQVFSTLIVVLFFVPGAIIYLILRPRETLDDAFQRTMEEEYLLQDLDDFPVCPTCRRSVRDEFLYCPHCRTELRLPCVACQRLVDVRWESCPYCGVTQYEDVLPTTIDEPDPLSMPAARQARTTPLQSIGGGRIRDFRASADDPRAEPKWDQHDTVQSIRAPDADEPESDPEAPVDDASDEASTPRPATARAARDQG
ncbi:MAG TPA: zinc ribbon domain-containing protein [Thermomicrobiales bacterium]|nr:zinc ribbon domain-containing protein [Thermomicrobiales bacterium]